MDSWTEVQLKKMELGGNSKMNEFFKQYGVEKSCPTKRKYNSKAAELYREKLAAEVSGRRFQLPPPSAVKAQAKESDEWDSWETSQRKPSSNAGTYAEADVKASMSDKEAFFNRKMAENAKRPEGVPPSKGGKFVGFGSSPPPKQQPRAATSDVGSMLYKGWGSLTQMAGTAAQSASAAVKTGTENLSQALKEREVSERVQTNARALADRGKELGKQGWSGLQSFYATVASKVESAARDNGYALDLGASKARQHQNRGAGGFTSATYARLSRSESGGLDELMNREQHDVDDQAAFQGFEDNLPDSPLASRHDVKDSGETRNLEASKNSLGSKSGPIASGQRGNKWQDWEDSDDDEVDDDWGKW